MTHSRFGASGAHRWMRCPGSVQLSAKFSNVSSLFAEEGTMLHEVAANSLLGVPHEYELTDEQQEVVRVYVDLIKTEAAGAELYVETRFKLPYHDEFWGTADAVVVHGNNLKVFDLKAGRGVSVEADYNGRVNPQLGFYALGACAHLRKYDWDSVEVIICQPRFGGVKRRFVSADELSELVAGMVEAADLAVSEQPPFSAGSHCKFCLAAPVCQTLRDFVYETAMKDFSDDAA